MVRRGWRNLLYLKYATAKAKAKRPLHLGKAAPSGTIENVGCELPPETKQRNLHSGKFQNLRLVLNTTFENSMRNIPNQGVLAAYSHSSPLAYNTLRTLCPMPIP